MADGHVYHFSQDPTIREFAPHIAPTSDRTQPYVWAIDAEHSPSYWFPRDCPRVTFWATAPMPPGERPALLGGSERVHAVEWEWLGRITDAVLHRYVFDATEFRPQDESAGYHVAERPVRPLRVEPVGDLLAAHRWAGIELRLVPNLWPLADAVPTAGVEFSMIRLRNAAPRPVWSDGGASRTV